MSKDDGGLTGIIAYVTTNKERYLGGDPLALFAQSRDEAAAIAEMIAEAFLAYIMQLPQGDYLVIKK